MKFSNEILLSTCLHGKSQNINKSINSIICRKFLKNSYAQSHSLKDYPLQLLRLFMETVVYQRWPSCLHSGEASEKLCSWLEKKSWLFCFKGGGGTQKVLIVGTIRGSRLEQKKRKRGGRVTKRKNFKQTYSLLKTYI